MSGSNTVVGIAALGLVCAACSSKTHPTFTPESVTVHLTHMPRGTAAIAYDAATKTLTVTVSATGLAPGSTHFEGIGKGSCTKGRGPLYLLKPLVVDAHGVGRATTVIRKVAAIPSGAFVHIHTGATKRNHGKGLACADLAGSP